MASNLHRQLDLRPLKWVVAHLTGRHLPDPLPILWARRYSAFVRRRYLKFARGKGDWQPLSPATIRQRRKGGRNVQGVAAILIDTGTLLAALVVGAPGNLFKRIRQGVRFGFGGTSRHPKGKATIADIARFHDRGGANLPRRRIIVTPDDRTIRGMGNDVKTTVGVLGATADRLFKTSMQAAFSSVRGR